MNARLRVTRALLVPAALLAFFSHHVYPESSVWDSLLEASGLLLLVAAMGGRIWASAHLVGRKNRTLVTDGPFAIVRNPLYLFSLIGFAGAGLAFGSLSLGAIFAAIFFAAHWPEILAEEARLSTLFGEEYEAYRERVPRMVPALRLPPLLRRSRGVGGSGAAAGRGAAGGSAAARGRSPEGELVIDRSKFMGALRDCLAIPFVFIIADLLEWAKIAEIIPVLVYLP